MPATTLALQDLIKSAERKLFPHFEQIDEVALGNQRRVLDAFRNNRISEEFFAEKTGYGIDDANREAVDQVFADIFGCQSAAVRLQIVSGTHALACALFGNLPPGAKLLSLTGKPYDTMEKVLGHTSKKPGSLSALGVQYTEANLIPELGSSDEKLRAALQPLLALQPTMVYIQKSRGYSFDRPTLSIKDVLRLGKLVHSIIPECIVMVDNCYGEFVEAQEPAFSGPSITAGSLIKNPGGGLAIGGGYLAGAKEQIHNALVRLTAPGIDGQLGLSFNQNRLLLQGLFLAPAIVPQALKGAMLFAHVFQELGFEVTPGPLEERGDIIQAIKLGTAERLVAFCQAVQRFSPVNAHVVPEPALMPGYANKVVMAGGTFVEGSTIEFSADGPLREPYAAYLQGGLSYLHVKCALKGALELAASGECPFLPQ
jgi:cystathionine gamma-lyase